MALALTLVRGAVTGIGKHPSPRAPLPDARLCAAAVRIDPRRVAAYSRVCGFPADPFSSRDRAGVPRLPVTYPHVLGFPLAARIMAARAFPLPLMGLVHTSVHIVARAPLTVADRPDIVAYAEELRAHRRGTEAVVVTEARLGGDVVWRDRSTYLARGAAPGGSGSGSGSDGTDDRTGTGSNGGTAAGRGPGAAPEPCPEPLPVVEEWRLPANLGRRHARVTGDLNPIHLWAWTARPLGFSRAIVHGMWTVARCAAAAGPDVTGLSAEFRKPVLLPSQVRYAAAGPAFEVRSPDGALHLRGTLQR